MRRVISLLCLLSFTLIGGHLQAEGPKEDPFQRLGKAELDKLAGKWEFAIDTRSGWKGKGFATFKVVQRGNGSFLSVQYDASATRGQEQLGLQNAPGFPVQLIPLSQGKTKYFVVVSGVAIQQFDPNAKERRVTYDLEADTLSVDAKVGYKSFVGTKALSDLDLAWNEWKLQRVKK